VADYADIPAVITAVRNMAATAAIKDIRRAAVPLVAILGRPVPSAAAPIRATPASASNAALPCHPVTVPAAARSCRLALSFARSAASLNTKQHTRFISCDERENQTMKHDITLLVTRNCHCSDIEQELRDLGLSYERCYAEEHSELVHRYQIRHCPVLIVDETRVISVDGLTAGRLRDLLNLGK